MRSAADAEALIALFAPRYINPCMTAICTLLDLRYIMLVARVNPPGAVPEDDKIEADITLVELTLRQTLRQR